MNAIYGAALEAHQVFRKKRWRYCIIGGLAVIRWGEPRATGDVDFNLLSILGKEVRIVDTLLGKFEGRIPDARQFALENRVLLCRASNGVPLDIALAGFPFEERVLDRSSRFKFTSKIVLTTASAEDLIVLKAIADRDQDWVDIRGILERQGSRLDWDQVLSELSALCELKEDTAPLQHLQTLRERTG
jgi:hypothetical protein